MKGPLPLVAVLVVLLFTPSYGSELEEYLKQVGSIHIGLYPDVSTLEESISGVTVRYRQLRMMYAGKGVGQNDISLYENDVHGIIARNPRPEKATFLPWKEDKATYMQLDRMRWGDWFFTAQLSGCEVWVAHNRDPETQLLLIHINAKNCRDDVSLGTREQLGAAALDRFNHENRVNFVLLHRVMKTIDKQRHPNSDEYLANFKLRHPHARISNYDIGAVFYGYTEAKCDGDKTVQYADWTFRLKDDHNGHFFAVDMQSVSTVKKFCNFLKFFIGGTPASSLVRKRAVPSSIFCKTFTSSLLKLYHNGLISLSGINIPPRRQPETGGLRFYIPPAHIPERVPTFIETLSRIYDDTYADNPYGPYIVASALPGSHFSIHDAFGNTYDLLGSLLESISIEQFTFNCSSTELHIKTVTVKSLPVIPGIFELQDATLAISATLSPITIKAFTFTGRWKIGSFNPQFTISDQLESHQLVVSSVISGGPARGIILNIPHFIEQLTGKSISLPVTQISTFSQIDIFGAIDTFAGGAATLTVSGRQGEGRVIKLILQKQVRPNSKYAGAFAATFSSFKFADIVRDSTGVDITGIPFIGSLSVPRMAVTVSTADIALINKIDSMSLLRFSGYHIEKGFSAFFILPSLSMLPVKMSYSSSALAFSILEGKSIGISTLLSQLGLSLNLPPGLDVISNVDIVSFSLNVGTRELYVQFRLPNTLKFFDDLIAVKNSEAEIRASLKSPKKLSVIVNGQIEVGNKDIGVSISRDATTLKYVISMHKPYIDFTDIVRTFGAAVVPAELSSVVDAAGFLKFTVNDLDLMYPIGGTPKQIHVSGQPNIAGLNGAELTAVVVRRGSTTQLIEGFSIANINIARLIQKFTSISLGGLVILDQDVNAAVLISPATLSGVSLPSAIFGGLSVNMGVSFRATMRWPPSCSSDLFCEVAQSAIGANAKFTLQGTITNPRLFTLEAAVPDLHLGSITMSQAGLQISVGTQIQIGIFGSVDLSSPDLTLRGSISVGTQGIVLEMILVGCWERPFGAKWLTICSLQVFVALKPGLPLAGFVFGGHVKIGDPSCGDQIAGWGYAGIDPVSPQENYYYLNITGRFTIGSILQALCIGVSLPGPIADSGFPNGFQASYSLAGKELPYIPVSIAQGYRLKGTIDILGLRAYADVTIGLPQGVRMVVSLPALHIAGGLLTMYASSSDTSKGPYFVANITLLPTPSVNVEASGFVSVLSISREAKLRITNSAYSITIQGKFLALFAASFELYAAYGDLRTVTFRVRGSFSADLFSRIEKKVQDAIKGAGDEATAAIESAQAAVDSLKPKFDAANDELRAAQKKVDDAKEKFDAAVAALNNVRERLNSVCTPPSCHPVCVPAPCGTTCCGSAWGRCVCRRPTFSSCCFRSPDVVCETQRQTCLRLRDTLNAALIAAEKVVDASKHTLDAAEAALEVPKAVVAAVKHSLDVAIAALEAAKQTYMVGLEAASAIADFALGGLINIREITFDVLLSAANGGSFSCSVKAIITGKSIDVNVNINVYNIATIASQLAEHAVSGISSFFG